MKEKLALISLWGACPPNGYRYVFPETGYIAHAWTYVDWVAEAKRHLRANELPEPPNLEELMQEQLCMTLDPGWCKYDDPGRPRPLTTLSWNDVAEGVKTFARWIAGGSKYVTQTEADRRALICSRCYLNVNVQGCSGCQQIVQEVVRDKHSKYDFAISACGVCHCLLKAKIHFPIQTLDKSGVNQQMYPEFCWLKKGGENYRE